MDAFKNRIKGIRKANHRPKVCLALIQAARQYCTALEVAEAARKHLVELAERHSADRDSALAALHYLADDFKLPEFAMKEFDANE